MNLYLYNPKLQTIATFIFNKLINSTKKADLHRLELKHRLKNIQYLK